MILQSLCDLYERLQASPNSNIAPEGLERKEIQFLIVLDAEGRFIRFEDTREKIGKKTKAKAYLVPLASNRTVQVEAQLLWDKPLYVFGYPKDEKEAKRAEACFQSFLEKQLALLEQCPADEGIGAICSFLRRREFEAVFQDPLWPEVSETGPFLTFRLVSDPVPVVQRNAVFNALQRLAQQETGNSNQESSGQCLVSGQIGLLVNLHPKIKGIRGGQTSGAPMVSFNLDSFRSYGKAGNDNAPIAASVAFAYSTALNYLLNSESRQKYHLSDTTMVFWSQHEHPIENFFTGLFGQVPDDPFYQTPEVKAVFDSIYKGIPPFQGDATQFYVLGLAPNAARVSVRFWDTLPVEKLAKHITQHFVDIEIERPANQPPPSLDSLLRSTALQGKYDNLDPTLAGETLHCIIMGQPYPRKLLLAALQRAKAERDLPYWRVALIKACLNRDIRYKRSTGKELTMALDTSQNNIGYVLGRLFAIFEKIQEESHPGIDETIRSRYYTAASSTPVTVFPRLMSLKNHHLAKIENPGRRVNLERLIGRVMDLFDGFPPLLSLEDQGRFAVGYYHQRQDFFKPKSSEDAAALSAEQPPLVTV